MEIKKIAHNVSLLASTRFVEFLSGLVRIKLTASIIGVKGVGVVEQLSFFAQQSATFSLMSLAEGFVKQVAEGKSVYEIKELLSVALKSYLLLIGCLTFIVLIVMFAVREMLTPAIFGSSNYLFVYEVALLCVPLLIANSVPFSILKAFKSTSEIAKARVWIVMLNLVVLIPMVLIWKLKGAVYSILLSYLITFLVNFYYAYTTYLKKYKIRVLDIIKAKLSKKFIKELMVFSGFGVSVGLYFIVSEFVVRSSIVKTLGIESIGLYSPVIMWASMLTGIVLPAFSTYLYPRFCELKTDEEVSNLINAGLRLVSFVVIPFIFLAIPTKHIFISIFYSKEFSGAAEYLPGHFLGVVVYVWWYVFSQSLTPTGRIKQHGAMLFVFYTLNILLVLALVDLVGLYAYMFKFLLAPVLIFCLYVWYCKKSMNFSFELDNLFLMSYIFVGGLTMVLFDMVFGFAEINFLVGPALIVGGIYFLNENEKRFVVTKLAGITNFRKKRQ